MPLMLASENGTHYVSRICANERTRRQLMHMGFIKDTPVYVKSAQNGNLIVDVRGAVMALDRKMASRILVERSLA